MPSKEQEQAKKAFLRRNPNLTKLVDRLLQSEDADALLERFEKIEKERRNEQSSECLD